MYAIEAKGLTKKYKDIIAVNSLDLTVNEGELFCMLGVNGAGKTTTVKMLTCLTAPTEGEGYILGESITRRPEKVKESIGVSPQETAVAPNLTSEENLQLICGVYGIGKAEAEKRISFLTEKLALYKILGRKAGKLSGGWQRRLSIAMALVTQPKVLFLDEPTLGLDVIARRELWDVINSLRGDTAIILTTHYMEEAEALSDRVGIMAEGCLVYTGTPKEIIAKTHTQTLEQAFVATVKGGKE